MYFIPTFRSATNSSDRFSKLVGPCRFMFINENAFKNCNEIFSKDSLCIVGPVFEESVEIYDSSVTVQQV